MGEKLYRMEWHVTQSAPDIPIAIDLQVIRDSGSWGGIAPDMEREREGGGGGLEGEGAAATMTNVHVAEWCSMQKICIARLLAWLRHKRQRGCHLIMKQGTLLR